MFFLEYSFLYHIIKISFHDDSVILYCFSRLLFYDAPIKKHIVARKYIPKIYKLDMQIFIRSSLAELFIIEKITNESALSCFIFRKRIFIKCARARATSVRYVQTGNVQHICTIIEFIMNFLTGINLIIFRARNHF